MASSASRLTPVVLLIVLAIVFLYLTQPVAPPLPIIHPEHNFDPSVIGPLLVP